MRRARLEARSKQGAPHCDGGSSCRSATRAAAPLPGLQRGLGNRALGRWLQAKLDVGSAHDPLEQEADRVADDATGASAPSGPVQRTPHASAPNASGGGRPLPDDVRAFFEPRLGHGLSDVRVHTDSDAAASARSIGAAAFTVGSDVVFGQGRYEPETSQGKRLIAHELTHVAQQARGADPQVIRRDLSTEEPPDAGLGDISGVPMPTPLELFYHGTTWRTVQSIPGNVQPVGGGDFGQGFYTHHDEDPQRAEYRARWEGCRLCQKLSPPVRYAGVVRFDVPLSEYHRLFDRRRTFGLTSTTQRDYAARQRAWLDFVSGPGRGRDTDPSYDASHMSWRHGRVDPPPDQGYDLIEGPFYRGVEGLPGSSVPPRSAFHPYAEGTTLPQQIVWNHERALAVLNAAPTRLTQYDARRDRECALVDPPVSEPPLNQSRSEDPRAAEEARRLMTGA